MNDLELRLPDDVMEHIPHGKTELVAYLSSYFDKVLDQYQSRFQKRVSGIMGQPLSRYEKSLLKDLLLDLAIGKIHEAHQLAAEGVSSIR